jgi:hypothetical protein
MTAPHFTLLLGQILLGAWCAYMLVTGLATLSRQRRKRRAWWR